MSPCQEAEALIRYLRSLSTAELLAWVNTALSAGRGAVT